MAGGNTIESITTGDDSLQLSILTLQLFQPLGVIDLHPAVLVTPPVERLLGDLQRLGSLRDRPALAEHPLGLAQLADDLLRGVPA